MNKKAIWILAAAIIAVIITVCTIFLINMGNSSDTDKKQVLAQTGEDKAVEDAYHFTFSGVDVTPGTAFNKETIVETPEESEVPSCAFDGMDKVYTYQNVEITTTVIDEKETVYSVYFLNTSVSTSNGVKISDSKDVMLQKYGENYNEDEGEFAYTSGDTKISFILENDAITSIEYTLKA